jgi:2'-5' RNA ligase
VGLAVSVRCFIAIELPSEVRTLFVNAGQAVRRADGRWRDEKWVSNENLHVTLKFAGHIAEPDVDVLVAACLRHVAQIPLFELTADGVRAVPSPNRARMLWGTLSDPIGMGAELAAAAERAALEVGVEPETRSFEPHVTLVRARAPHSIAPEGLGEANRVVSAAHAVVSVSAATVFRSTLGKSGPRYTALATCPLAG